METTIQNITLTKQKKVNLKFEDQKLNTKFENENDIDCYVMKSLKEIRLINDGKETFGILLNFERSRQGTNGILISYNLMCATLVIISAVNFLIDPKDSNRAAVLVALILVLATVFNAAQVLNELIITT